MNSPQATIILKSPDGAWTTVGTEASRGIVPEGITLTANESGPDTCSFSLRREASVPWPDLLAFNQAEILVGNAVLWGGRIWEAPLSDADEDVIAVAGRGWQYHLDDDLLQRSYVRSNLGGWRASRDLATCDLTQYTAIGTVDANGGVINLQWPAGSIVTATARVGVTLDFGSAAEAPLRIVLDYATNADTTGIAIYVRSHDLENIVASEGVPSISDAGTISGTTFTALGRSGTLAGTFGARRRYVSIFAYYSAGAGTFGADWRLSLKRVLTFRQTAYESGNASVLKASDVFEDVLASGSLLLLDSSTSNIGTTAFSIPELAPSGYQTPRSLMAAANAYEGNLFGVDAERKVFLRERDEVPLTEVGAWPGASFQDASTNSGEGLYNRVYVQGTGPDGAPVQSLAQASPSSLISRQGFLRSAVVTVEAAITSAGAGQIAGLWLLERENPPLKGSLVVSGWGGARYINGGDVHPSEFLLRYGQRIRLGQLVDPSTGDQGRDGIIKSVSYSHDTETASLELDSERGRLETLLSRLAVVTGQIR